MNKEFTIGTINDMIGTEFLQSKMNKRANEFILDPAFKANFKLEPSQEVYNVIANALAIGYVMCLVEMERGELKMLSKEEVIERKDGERDN